MVIPFHILTGAVGMIICFTAIAMVASRGRWYEQLPWNMQARFDHVYMFGFCLMLLSFLWTVARQMGWPAC